MTANELILVIYLDNRAYNNAENIHGLVEYLTDTLPNVKFIILPSKENKIDCINPIMVSEEVYRGVSEKVDKANEILDKIINKEIK